MLRVVVVAGALMLVLGATAAGRTGEKEARPRTLANVRGSVDALVQDGRRIAWISTEARCGRQVRILTLPGRRPVYVGSRRDRSCVVSRGDPLPAIALSAKGRVLWQRVSEGDTCFEIDLLTAALRDPRTRLVTPTYFENVSNPDYGRDYAPKPPPRIRIARSGQEGRVALGAARARWR